MDFGNPTNPGVAGSTGLMPWGTGVAGSILPIYFQPGGAGAGGLGAPLYRGSAGGGKAIPQPGATLTINEFGLDVDERSWGCPTALAAQAKPNIRDAHPYIKGLVCVSSVSIEGEGGWSTIRATYKGLVGAVRPAARSFSCGTDTQTVKILPTLSVEGIAVPMPIFTLRGATEVEPDASQVGRFFSAPPGGPEIAEEFFYLFHILYPGQTVTLIFKPIPQRWLCSKMDWTEAGLHFETTQEFTMRYYAFSGNSVLDSAH